MILMKSKKDECFNKKLIKILQKINSFEVDNMIKNR